MNTEPQPPPSTSERVISGGDITASIVGGVIYIVVAGCGLLNLLAALQLWNPLHWEGRLWTGIFMVAAPTALFLMAALPYRIRQKLPESVVGVGIVALWIAFFWAACGGR